MKYLWGILGIICMISGGYGYLILNKDPASLIILGTVYLVGSTILDKLD